MLVYMQRVTVSDLLQCFDTDGSMTGRHLECDGKLSGSHLTRLDFGNGGGDGVTINDVSMFLFW